MKVQRSSSRRCASFHQGAWVLSSECLILSQWVTSVSGLCEQPSWKARSFINHRHPSSASVHKILFQWTFIYIVLMCWASFPTWSSSLIQSVSDSISMGSTVCQDRTAILESCNISYKSFVILFQLHQYTRFYSNVSCSRTHEPWPGFGSTHSLVHDTAQVNWLQSLHGLRWKTYIV